MLTIRSLFAVTMSAGSFLLAGCGSIGTPGLNASNKQATEERQLSTPHVAGSGLEVKTLNGAIEVVADRALTDVKITAKVTGYGDTDEEAKARMAEVKVIVNRRQDQMLEIDAELPKDKNNVRGACALVIRVPDAKGCKASSGSGSIVLTGLAGHMDAKTDNGSITVKEAGGTVKAKSGSGSLAITKAAGDVDAQTDNGSVKVTDAQGTVKVKSGSGSIEITKPGGLVAAHTDNGTVTVQDAPRDVKATSGSGRVMLKRVTGAANVNTSNGTIAIEQVAGPVEAYSGSGSVTYLPAADSNSSFQLKTENGSVTVKLPKSVGGTIKADTANGRITVDGTRKPASVVGEKSAKKIVITNDGPESRIHSGSGSITITLE